MAWPSTGIGLARYRHWPCLGTGIGHARYSIGHAGTGHGQVLAWPYWPVPPGVLDGLGLAVEAGYSPGLAKLFWGLKMT